MLEGNLFHKICDDIRWIVKLEFERFCSICKDNEK